MTEQPAFRRRHSLRDQIERAAVSVSNNIAEGFERGTNQELLTFLYIARGSAGEVRSMLCLLRRMPAFHRLESGILNLQSQADGVSRQLGAWIRTLRDSGMRGERYVTEKTRQAEQKVKGRKEFLEELARIHAGGLKPGGGGAAPETGGPELEAGGATSKIGGLKLEADGTAPES